MLEFLFLESKILKKLNEQIKIKSFNGRTSNLVQKGGALGLCMHAGICGVD